MEKRSRAEVLFGVPPVTRTRSAAAGAENALVHAIKLGAILLTLQILLPFPVSPSRRRSLSLEPGLDALVLIIEIGHVHDEVLHHEHVRQRRDGGGGGSGSVDFGEASE